MNAVLYYSNTSESFKVAEYAAEFLNLNAIDIQNADNKSYENAVIVFPVHCQGIPIAVRSFLQNINVKNAIILVCYGKMSYGNVIYECANKYGINIVGGAYIPAKHSYIPDDTSFKDMEKLDPILKKLHNPTTVNIPRSFKNPLASVFPLLRSRLGIKLKKSTLCTNCGLCNNICKNKKCIRCLKCVKYCPQNALSFKTSLFMSLYLKKKPKSEPVIYK